MNETSKILVDLANAASKARNSLIRAGKVGIQREIGAARTRVTLAALDDALKAARKATGAGRRPAKR